MCHAAEIFAAVLQEHGRAAIVGRKTAGAVLASWYHGLPDGGELQLSRQDYVTPKGRRLENEGVEPDVKVERTLADLRAGHGVLPIGPGRRQQQRPQTDATASSQHPWCFVHRGIDSGKP